MRPEPGPLLTGLRALRDDVGKPCVVAVVGQVNAGKSTFINALLGDDKAVVGTTETTATVNHFVYGGTGAGAAVRCHWRSGHVTDATPEFLASLQGHDADTLERAAGIARLEYALPIPMLRTISIVDTPGAGSKVEEHESRTAEFLELENRLRDRHDAETRTIHETADAVIYLVGAVAHALDEELLDRFASRGGVRVRAMNTLGVLAKADISPQLVARRHELARKIAGQLEGELNDVVPVSAGMARALDRLGDAGLQALIDVVRPLPEAQLSLLLRDESLFTSHDPEGCPVPAADRRRLYDAARCEWRVFATIVAAARDAAGASELRAAMEELAGFDVLWRTLHDHFLVRAQMLRCFRIAVESRGAHAAAWFDEIVRCAMRHWPTAPLERFSRSSTGREAIPRSRTTCGFPTRGARQRARDPTSRGGVQEGRLTSAALGAASGSTTPTSRPCRPSRARPRHSRVTSSRSCARCSGCMAPTPAADEW